MAGVAAVRRRRRRYKTETSRNQSDDRNNGDCTKGSVSRNKKQHQHGGKARHGRAPMEMRREALIVFGCSDSLRRR